jgi:hypothetical protein
MTDIPEPTEPADDADRLALLWNSFQQLTDRLDTTEDAIEQALIALTDSVNDLDGKLALLLKKEREKDIQPRRWAARATPQDWDQLIDWVDQLNTDYSILSDHTIPPCWPAHPGVVEELAGLHRAWIRAHINDELAKQDGSNDLTAWHDRWLWPLLRRLKAGHYRTTNCRDRHHNEPTQTISTDRALVRRPVIPEGKALR